MHPFLMNLPRHSWIYILCTHFRAHSVCEHFKIKFSGITRGRYLGAYPTLGNMIAILGHFRIILAPAHGAEVPKVRAFQKR